MYVFGCVCLGVCVGEIKSKRVSKREIGNLQGQKLIFLHYWATTYVIYSGVLVNV